MNEKERIALLLEYFDLNASSLAKNIGLSTPQVFYDIKSGKCGISKELAKKIQEKYLNVNMSWLLTGEGEMLKQSSENDGFYTTYLLPTSAKGGTLSDFTFSVDKYECEKIITPVKNVDFAITVTGDSMAPEYPNGSKILIKRINEKAFIDWGRVYVLDTCNGTVIKKIMPGSESDCVKCVSINEDYPDFEVKFCDMNGMYRVIMLLSEK